MQKIKKLIGYTLILSIPITLVITGIISKFFFGKFIIFNQNVFYIFFVLCTFITVIIAYLLSNSERKYIKYDEKNIEIMYGIFIPKPIKNKFQYGSSWFLQKEEIEKTFSYNVLKENKMIKMLLLNKSIDEELFEQYKFEKGGICLGLEKNR